jgi:hypothetical protein
VTRLARLAVIAAAFAIGAARALILGATIVLVGCPAVREGVMRVTPGVPPPSGCSPVGASRCEGAVPVVCSGTGRWWPATPTGEACAHGCAVLDGPDGGAYCAAADGGAQ